MFQGSLIGLLLGATLWSASAAAQKHRRPIVEISYERALSLARRRAPAIAAARARAREAASQVATASVWRLNPQLFGSAGPRFRSGDTTVDWSVSARQWLEIGGKRGARVNAALAGAQAGRARGANAERLILRDVSRAFVSALYWQRRAALAQENLRIARAVARVAARRHEVGDAGGLERSVSALSVVRARAEEDRARAVLTQATGRLKTLLGLDAATTLMPRGDLRRLGIPQKISLDISRRPDLEALRASIRQAKAEAEMGRATRVPRLAVGAGYSREESANIVRGTLGITLPVFDYGQGTTRVAESKRERVRAELAAAKVAASVEVHTADATVRRLGEAARRFEDSGLATLARAERLATASYKAGAIPLGELLVVRRELVQAKLDYTNLLYGAATARTDLLASTGRLGQSQGVKARN